MAVFTDGIGNAYLGDCIYANHNVNYETQKFLQTNTTSTISADLSAMASSAGLLVNTVISQSNVYTDTLNPIVVFGPQGDMNNRYAIYYTNFYSDVTPGSQALASSCKIYNNSGWVNALKTNAVLAVENANNVVGLGTDDTRGFACSIGIDSPATRSAVQWVGVANNKSLALLSYRYLFDVNQVRMNFHYIGELADVNTNYNYYNQNIITKSIAFATVYNGATNSFPSLVGGHYIATTAKPFLQTGDAQYPIVCADGQTPTAQWATDFYVFDNNATYGYPAIGRVRNLLLATGSYTIGKPVKIQGNAKPDNGFNRWLPVGTYAGKTVLMRCYSSVNI